MSVYDKEAYDPKLKITENMVWVSCNKCGCPQLKYLVEPSVLYYRPHNPSIGKMWEKHNLEFSKIIAKYKPLHIMEVGGANLKLANIIVNDGVKKYDVIDFSAGKYETEPTSKKINLYRTSIEEYKIAKKIDAVVLSHTFEHFYEPLKILTYLYDNLVGQCRLFISVPNIENQIHDGFLNALNYEHSFYINKEYLEYLFGLAGFLVEEKYDFTRHNIFYVLKKSNSVIPLKIPFNKKPQQIFTKFVDNCRTDVENIKATLHNKNFYVFGAHIFAQFLFHFGLDKNGLLGLLDNDPQKIGNYLCGVDYQVFHPSVIVSDTKPIVVLRASQYSEEIKQQLTGLNHGCVFV